MVIDEFLIENESLEVRVKRKGAELCSVKSRDGNQFIWQAEEVWPRHAPNLFPIVGSLLDHEYILDHKVYPLTHHGFARDCEFDLLHQSEHSICLVLQQNPYTLKSYPFKFTFLVTFQLDGNTLIQKFRVINDDSRPIPVSFGGHPAFNANPIHEFDILFDRDEYEKSYKLSGPYIGENRAKVIDGRKIELTKTIFNDDALVFKKLNSTSVTLKKRDANYAIRVDISQFPYLGIWSKPNAPFVCIEPWQGLADSINHSKEIVEKEGIVMVRNEIEKSFSMTFTD